MPSNSVTDKVSCQARVVQPPSLRSLLPPMLLRALLRHGTDGGVVVHKR